MAGATLLAIAAPALAAPAAPGALTNHEFTVLTAAQLGLKQALSNRDPNWTKEARNACLNVTFGGSTALLQSQKTDCLGAVQLEAALTSFPAADSRCATRGQSGKIRCLAPLYRALARDAATAYRGDLGAQQASVKRGLTGACLLALGSTPRHLADDRKLVASTKRLSADMYMLVKIVDGRTPPSTVNEGRVDSDSRVFEHDAHQVLRDSPHGNLGSCPHPPE